ncbi:hypothetical protein BH10PSE4_BH10PSE4_39900 [soil metagenome]
MRAVWSFWSAPFFAHYESRWLSHKHHLLAWALSFKTASQHYPDTALVTDTAGARLLVDGLGLEFGSVDLRLDSLVAEGRDVDWWVLGKLTAYEAQTRPFVHLDNDVFLWRPLPEAMTAAPVFAQNPEGFEFTDQSLYRLEAFMAGVADADGWLPPEWRVYAQARRTGAVCCGILGGQDVAFLRRYAALAIAVIVHPRNQRVWPGLGVRDNILVEQYFLAACIASRQASRGLPSADFQPAYLFPSPAEAFEPAHAAAAGYTHLIGEAKVDAEIADRLERRVRADYPDLHARCVLHAG